MKIRKLRLDELLVQRGLAESQGKAEAIIRSGVVFTEHERLDKPGRLIAEDADIQIKGQECPYVSRGGMKLAGALDHLRIDPSGCVALDLGASTGGFTDCLLQRGAVRVYAIDVGRGQLHQKLELDQRVVARERTHLSDLRPAEFNPPPNLCVADLSFISLRRAFPVIRELLHRPGDAVVLVKPQFEVERHEVPPGGIVTDRAIHHRVIAELSAAAEAAGLAVLASIPSVIKGGDGNQEYFLHLRST